MTTKADMIKFALANQGKPGFSFEFADKAKSDLEEHEFAQKMKLWLNTYICHPKIKCICGEMAKVGRSSKKEKEAENPMYKAWIRACETGEHDFLSEQGRIAQTIMLPNPNCGRLFFGCSKDYKDNSKCNYFKWLDVIYPFYFEEKGINDFLHNWSTLKGTIPEVVAYHISNNQKPEFAKNQ